MGADRLLVCGFVLAGLVTGAAAADDGLIRYEGRDYGIDHASPRLRTLLYDLDLDYYRQRRMLVDELLYEIYLKTEAERRGITTGALAEELLRIEAPTERDIRTFYRDNRSRIGQPYGEMRDRIDQHLRDQRLRAEKAGLLARVKSEGEFLLLMSPPEPPPLAIDTEGFPRKGAAAPRFTIVEFGDYQCPHCGKAARVLRRIVELIAHHSMEHATTTTAADPAPELPKFSFLYELHQEGSHWLCAGRRADEERPKVFISPSYPPLLRKELDQLLYRGPGRRIVHLALPQRLDLFTQRVDVRSPRQEDGRNLEIRLR